MLTGGHTVNYITHTSSKNYELIVNMNTVARTFSFV